MKKQAIQIGGLGVLLGFGIFLLSRYLGLDIPAEIAIAFGTIIGWLVGKILP